MPTNAHKGDYNRDSNGMLPRYRGMFYNGGGQLVLPNDFIYVPYRTGWQEPTARWQSKSGSFCTMTVAENLGPNGYGIHLGPQDFNRIPYVTNNQHNSFFYETGGNFTTSGNTLMYNVRTTWDDDANSPYYYSRMHVSSAQPAGLHRSGLAITSTAATGDNFANLRINGTVQDPTYGMPAGTYYFTGFFQFTGNEYISANDTTGSRLVFICNYNQGAGLASLSTTFAGKTGFQHNGFTGNVIPGAAGWRYVEIPFTVADNNGINLRLQAPKNTNEPIIWTDLGIWSVPGMIANGVNPRDTHPSGKMYYEGTAFGPHGGYIGLWVQPLSFDTLEDLWDIGYNGRLNLQHGLSGGTTPFFRVYTSDYSGGTALYVTATAASTSQGWGADYLARKPVHAAVLYRKDGANNQVRLVINGGEQDTGWTNVHTARGPGGEIFTGLSDFTLGLGSDAGVVVSDLVIGRTAYEAAIGSVYHATKPRGGGIWEPQKASVGTHLYV